MKLQIWDTPGGEKYRSHIKLYYNDVKIVFLALDLTEDKEEANLGYWFEEIHSEKLEKATVFLIGCKADD